MAFVFEALDRETNELVAVKRLRLSLKHDARLVSRFRREMTVTNLLDHPHCARLLDRGEDADGVPYFVMPRLRGACLDECFLRPAPPQQVVEIGLQLLDALDYLHALGVAHRDVKPENLFLVGGIGKVETVVLIDFGLAKFFSGEDDGNGLVTIPGTFMGTPGAMSPEQILSEDVDHRADLYGVGVVMYTMLAGRRPFDEDEHDFEEVLRQQVHADYPRLPQTVHEPVRRFVDRLLHPDPNARPASAQAASEALEQIQRTSFRDNRTWHDLFAPASDLPRPAPQNTVLAPRETIRAGQTVLAPRQHTVIAGPDAGAERKSTVIAPPGYATSSHGAG